MLQQRIQYHQQIRTLDHLLAEMPTYPISWESNGEYSIYTDGQCLRFPSLMAARLGQLQARAAWLRRHPEIV